MKKTTYLPLECKDVLVNRVVGGNKERSEGNLKRAAKHLLQTAYRPDLCIIEEHTAPATLPSGEFSVSSISKKVMH